MTCNGTSALGWASTMPQTTSLPARVYRYGFGEHGGCFPQACREGLSARSFVGLRSLYDSKRARQRPTGEISWSLRRRSSIVWNGIGRGDKKLEAFRRMWNEIGKRFDESCQVLKRQRLLETSVTAIE